jgi:hypothetical protein
VGTVSSSRNGRDRLVVPRAAAVFRPGAFLAEGVGRVDVLAERFWAVFREG